MTQQELYEFFLDSARQKGMNPEHLKGHVIMTDGIKTQEPTKAPDMKKWDAHFAKANAKAEAEAGVIEPKPESERLIKGKTADGKEVVIAHVRSAYDDPKPKAEEPKKASPKPTEKPAKAEVKHPQLVEKPKAAKEESPKIVPVTVGTELPWNGSWEALDLLVKTNRQIWAADGALCAGNKSRIVKIGDHPEVPDGGYVVIAHKGNSPFLKMNQENLGEEVGSLIEQMRLDEMTVWNPSIRVNFSDEEPLYPELLKLLKWLPEIPSDPDIDAVIDTYGVYTVGANKQTVFFRGKIATDQVSVAIKL